jgi:hypothetical protein
MAIGLQRLIQRDHIAGQTVIIGDDNITRFSRNWGGESQKCDSGK